MEHRKRVFAFNQPTRGENDGYKMCAAILEEWQRRGPSKKLLQKLVKICVNTLFNVP